MNYPVYDPKNPNQSSVSFVSRSMNCLKMIWKIKKDWNEIGTTPLLIMNKNWKE